MNQYWMSPIRKQKLYRLTPNMKNIHTYVLLYIYTLQLGSTSQLHRYRRWESLKGRHRCQWLSAVWHGTLPSAKVSFCMERPSCWVVESITEGSEKLKQVLGKATRKHEGDWTTLWEIMSGNEKTGLVTRIGRRAGVRRTYLILHGRGLYLLCTSLDGRM